jgi:hypothetical protein
MAKCSDCQTEYHESGCSQIDCTRSIIVGSYYAAHMISHFEKTLTTDYYQSWEAPQNICPRCYHRGYAEYVGTSLVDNAVDMYSQVYDHIEYINTRCWEQDKLDVYDTALKLNTLICDELPNHRIYKLYRVSVIYRPTLRSVSAHVGYDISANYNGFAVYLKEYEYASK